MVFRPASAPVPLVRMHSTPAASVSAPTTPGLSSSVAPAPHAARHPVPPLPAGMVPGSQSSRIFALLFSNQAETGQGLLSTEVWTRLESVYGIRTTSARVQSLLSTLVTKGHAVPVSGRGRHIRYGAPTLPAPAVRDPDSDRFVAAVAALERRLGHAPSTAEVRAELRRVGGPVPPSTTLRRRLANLARPLKKGRGAWHREVRLEEVPVEGLTGALAIHWRTVGSTAEPPAVVASESNAARLLVQRAEAAFGRPASRQEIVLWIEHDLLHGSAEDVALARRVPPQRLHYWLQLLLGRPIPTRPDGGRLEVRRVVRPTRNAGTHRVRFTFALEAPATAPIIETEHAAESFAVAAEAESLDALAATVARECGAPSSALAAEMLAARRRALAEALDAALPAEPAARAAGLAGARVAAERLVAWTAVSPVILDHAEGRNLAARVAAARRRLADVEALTARLSADARPAMPGASPDSAAPVAVVGDAATLSHDEARALVDALAAAVRPDLPKDRLVFIASARRLRRPASSMRDRGVGLADAVIDRVDAVALIMRADDQPRAQTLVARAHALLGHVVRDADLLVRLLERYPHAEAADRRAAVVACGMLGRVPDSALAVPDPSDALDTRAYLLACAIGDPAGAVARIDAADRRAVGGARSITDTALVRAESGRLIAVIG